MPARRNGWPAAVAALAIAAVGGRSLGDDVVNGGFELREAGTGDAVGWTATVCGNGSEAIVRSTGGNPCSFACLLPAFGAGGCASEGVVTISQEDLTFCSPVGFATIEFDARSLVDSSAPELNGNVVRFMAAGSALDRLIPDTSGAWRTFHLSVPLSGLVFGGTVDFDSSYARKGPTCEQPQRLELDIDNVQCYVSETDLTDLFDEPLEACPCPNPGCVLDLPLPTDGGVGCPEPEGCAADLNEDGVVDIDDLLILLGGWGCSGECCSGDLNGDNIVDILDLGLLLASWGAVCTT